MGIPLAALSIRPPAAPEDPLASYGKVMQTQAMQQEQQVRQMQMEEARRQQQDQEIIRQAFMETGGDFPRAMSLAASRGASPIIITKAQEAHAGMKQKVSQSTETDFKNLQTSTDLMARAQKAVKDSPTEYRPKIYAQQRYALGQAGVDVSQLPPTYPGDDALPMFDATIGMSSALVKEERERRELEMKEKEAKAKLPGQEAESTLAAQKAAMTPEEREMLTATETSLAGLAAKGNATAQKALALLRQHKAATAGAEATAKMRGEMSAMGGVMGGASGAAPATGAGQTNEAFLKGLNPAIANQVKALSEGRMQFPGSFALRSPYWQNMIALVSQYDPGFDATQWSVRTQVRQDFTKGKTAANIRSLNTAIGHLDTLRDKGEKLSNAGMPLWNRIANYGITQAGDPRVTAFNNAANAVAGEAATVFKGTAGTDQEIRAWREQLNSSQSPEQIKASIDTITELLASRMDALDSQWQTGMKRVRDFKLLNDKSVGILRRMGRKDLIEGDLPAAVSAPGASASPMTTGAIPPPAAGSIRTADDYLKKLRGEVAQ